MERKSFTGSVVDASPTGEVSAVVAIVGSRDLGGDRIAKRAFQNSLRRRGKKLRVVDSHRTDSVLRVIGKHISAREIARSSLPGRIQREYPDAKGGLLCKMQMLLNTPEGKGAYERLSAGAIDDWSFAYNVVRADFSKEEIDGKQVTTRNLHELDIMEYGPCVFGMHPGTSTVSAKRYPRRKITGAMDDIEFGAIDRMVSKGLSSIVPKERLLLYLDRELAELENLRR